MEEFMHKILPYVEQLPTPMAQYMVKRFVVPYVQRMAPDDELFECFGSLAERAQSDLNFQSLIFGEVIDLFPGGTELDCLLPFAIVRAFSLSGNWAQESGELYYPGVHRSPPEKIVQLFFIGAIGVPSKRIKDRMTYAGPEWTLDPEIAWKRMCPFNTTYLIRGSLAARYAKYKAIFYAMCNHIKKILGANNATVLSILSLYSTFNLYNNVQILLRDFATQEKHVSTLKLDISEERISEAVSKDDKIYLDQAALQSLRDGQQELFKNIDSAHLFPETQQSLGRLNG